MTPGEQAEHLIARFGITSPTELDLEAIAFDAGMEIMYEDLIGCEAMLVGFKNRAIASIKPSIRGRERFSIGHELGHWQLHRGKSFKCRIDDPSDTLASDRSFEKQADTFASHLLMPRPLFEPAVHAAAQLPGFKHLDEVASAFETSLTATCIRFAQIDSLPVIVACYNSRGLRWYSAAPHVPKRWRLRKVLDDDSFAFDLCFRGKQQRASGKQPAEVWFLNSDADRYEIFEHSAPGRAGEILVLIYLTDIEMFEAEYDSVQTNSYLYKL